MAAKYEECPNCGSGETAYAEPRTKTCIDCAHQWDIDTGKPVG